MKTYLIVTPHFAPELEYQEWVLCKGLARLGYRVLVLTKEGEALLPESQRKLAAFPQIEIKRLKCLSWRSTAWPFPTDLSAWIQGAEGCLLSAPIHGFSYYIGQRLPADLPKAIMFSEFQNWDQPWLARTVKGRWYGWLFANAQRLCATTPFGIEFIKEKGAAIYPDKLHWTPLPFDEADFFWPPPATYTPPPASETRWLISPTRMNRQKPIAEWLETVITFLKPNPQWNYRMIGLVDETLRPELDSIIQQHGLVGRVEILGMMNGADLLEQYWQADLALYFRPSIGIQQALATGIPVITETRPSVTDHLIKDGFNGYYYHGLTTLAEYLTKAANTVFPSREEQSGFAMQWNSRNYVKRVLDV